MCADDEDSRVDPASHAQLLYHQLHYERLALRGFVLMLAEGKRTPSDFVFFCHESVRAGSPRPCHVWGNGWILKSSHRLVKNTKVMLSAYPLVTELMLNNSQEELPPQGGWRRETAAPSHQQETAEGVWASDKASFQAEDHLVHPEKASSHQVWECRGVLDNAVWRICTLGCFPASGSVSRSLFYFV